MALNYSILPTFIEYSLYDKYCVKNPLLACGMETRLLRGLLGNSPDEEEVERQKVGSLPLSFYQEC